MSNQSEIKQIPSTNVDHPREDKPKSKAKRARDKLRQEQNRKATGEKVMAELQKELDKRLYFGFANEVKAAPHR